MLLTITKVTVDRNKIISTVIYIFCFCHDYVFFIFQFSSRTVMFNKKKIELRLKRLNSGSPNVVHVMISNSQYFSDPGRLSALKKISAKFVPQFSSYPA